MVKVAEIKCKPRTDKKHIADVGDYFFGGTQVWIKCMCGDLVVLPREKIVQIFDHQGDPSLTVYPAIIDPVKGCHWYVERGVMRRAA